jgi:hypothetical protein
MIRDVLTISQPTAGRSTLRRDLIEASIVEGTWKAPFSGDTLLLPDGTSRPWEPATANADGEFQGRAMRGGYAYASVNAPQTKIMLLDAQGHTMVYVNGEPRVGDVYSNGTTRLPVMLKAGKNDFLFATGRGRLKAKLTDPDASVFIETRDPTLPDLVVGERADTWGAVIVVNATDREADGLSLLASVGGGKPTRTALPTLLPLSARKIGFRIRNGALKTPGETKLNLILEREGRRNSSPAVSLPLRIRKLEETRKRTFVSDIDGSVQYFGHYPAQSTLRKDKHAPPPALVLTLHGAGVEGIGQVDAYSPKSWAHLVAPTNRRPYGFDWEEWGRLDALEVLNITQKEFRTDPQRTYLTGHSMGGHGTWQVGVTYPDRFAAIAPSAGWISFSTYAGGRRSDNPSPTEAMLWRASSPGDTMSLVRNTASQGVYILHGDADDNVPVTQARTMADALEEFHRDFTHYEQPGAGHWWDVSDEPGADCVDWLPLFDLFSRRTLPRMEEVRRVEFSTASPGVSAWSQWVGIEGQVHPLQLSTVKIQYDPGHRRFVGTTENVSRLALRLDPVQMPGPLQVSLDGQAIANIPFPVSERILRFAHNGDRWEIAGPPDPSRKGPHRYGPFKDAFRHRMLFVYGTKGNAEENAWAFAKARYDAETFWYRGNGSVDILPDTRFDPKKEPDRSVILYGNADTNAAWSPLLGDSPVQVMRNRVQMGNRVKDGGRWAALFLRPRPGSEIASVGAVSGSGIVGMRLTDRMPYFTSGTGFPDLILLEPEALRSGEKGIAATGFFGEDWGVERGEWVYNE